MYKIIIWFLSLGTVKVWGNLVPNDNLLYFIINFFYFLPHAIISTSLELRFKNI